MFKIFTSVLLIIVLVACQKSNSDSSTTGTATSATNQETVSDQPYVELCFLDALNKDTTIVNIAIQGDSVTGEMKWLPYEKDGAIGTLKGTIKNNIITADYNYIIEGSNEIEEKIFVLETDKLIEKTGPLEEKNGKLVMKDPAHAEIGTTLKKVDCSL